MSANGAWVRIDVGGAKGCTGVVVERKSKSVLVLLDAVPDGWRGSNRLWYDRSEVHELSSSPGPALSAEGSRER